MAAVLLEKISEKVVIWLHREHKTQQWLAMHLGQTRQSISQKMIKNSFSDLDIMKIKQLGCQL